MKRKASPIAKAILENNNVENMTDIQGLMKNLYKDIISILLESEMEETLGYSKLKELDKKYVEYKAPLKSWFDNWNELSTFSIIPKK